MSSKNQLQEYFQKQKQPCPKYTTELCGGQAHCPQFKSTVNLFDQTFESDICSTKRDAELNVAEKVLVYLDTEVSSAKQYEKPKYIKTIVLLDLENVPQAKDFEFPDHAYVIGFMSGFSPLYSQRDQYALHMHIETINSAIKDAADTLLVFSAARLLYEEKIPKSTPIYIVTRDHFASALVDILQEKGYKAMHIIDYNLQGLAILKNS